MKLRVSFLASVAVAMVLALFGGFSDVSSHIIPAFPIQPFASDALGGISTNKLDQSIAGNYTITQTLAGERSSLPWIFSGPGFWLDLDKEIVDGTQVGTVWTNIDANCNGEVDYMAGATTFSGDPPVPTDPLKWLEATTAVEGTSEDYLKAIMPPFSWLLRHKVDIDHLILGTGPGSVGTVSVLNTVYAAIPYSPNGSTFVAQTKLGGAPTTPPSSVCLDTPQSSESVTWVYNNPPNDGDIDGVCNQVANQCADAGVYGEAPDLYNVTIAAPFPAAVNVDVEKHKVNSGPEAGTFAELWMVNNLTPAIVTGEWVPPGAAAFVVNVFLPVGVDVEQHQNLEITCHAPGWGLLVLKNILFPLPPTEDTNLGDNVGMAIILVKCGTPATTPEVDKEVSLIKADPSQIAPTTPGVPVPVAIDELKANHATVNVLGNETLEALVSDVTGPVPGTPDGVPDLTVAWAPGVIVRALGHSDLTPTVTGGGTPTISFTVDEWPGQADVLATLNIACAVGTPAGLYAAVVVATDMPAASFETKASDNANHRVITVRCGGAADDGKVDGDGLYARWTILASQGSSSLARLGDLRKSYTGSPSIPSDIGYVERIIDLQCFWIDEDGGAPAGADGVISEVESWQDPDLLALGTIGTVDPDGDCAIDAAFAQPGHPVDLPTIAGTCPKLQYSEYPVAVTNTMAKDADCDGLVDGIEKAWGSNPLLADSDDDGSPDFVEMFMFTNPVNNDTDGDGFLDKPANVYGNNTDVSMDNCPSVYNPTQLNSDGARRVNGGKITNIYASTPGQDKLGDACDDDNDNDGAVNGYESAAAQGTEPLQLDTDCDTVMDGAELRVNDAATAKNPAVKSAWSNVQQVYYRGCHINTAKNSEHSYTDWDAEYDGLEDDAENDLDGDGIICPTDKDSDNGTGTGAGGKAEVIDQVEAYGYNTGLANKDTDGDGCDDWVEIHDINGDRTVDSSDYSLLAKRFANKILSDCTGGVYPGAVPCSCVSDLIFDVNKDGTIDSSDISSMGKNSCLLKIGVGGCPTCPAEN